jgi:RNA polymerase sigma-70 factor (ECF subfamily)
VQGTAQDRPGEQTFAEFYNKHLAFVFRNAVRLLGPDYGVEDVVQEVFIVAARRRGQSRTGTRQSVDWEHMVDPEEADSVERAQLLRTVHELLEKLDPDKREVFILAELEQMTETEIAQALGIPPTTVHGRLRDARRDFEAQARRHRARDRRWA